MNIKKEKLIEELLERKFSGGKIDCVDCGNTCGDENGWPNYPEYWDEDDPK